MRENEYINIIKKISGNNYIGDDCAYLKDLDVVITQDSLIENVHFKREWYTPRELGYKSVAVNISDIAASGAIPAYVTIALSLPKYIDNSWISEFYKGAKEALCGAEIVGGDITGSLNDIAISVCALGKTADRKISSRKNAKTGYVIVVSGKDFGSGAAGLNELINNVSDMKFAGIHKRPEPDMKMSKDIAKNINTDYAMMDTSDGLADSLFKIAEQSGVKIVVNYDLIPHSDLVTREQVLFGGEDYNLVAAIPENFARKLNDLVIIGNIKKYDGVRLDISGSEYSSYDELSVYDHFGE